MDISFECGDYIRLSIDTNSLPQRQRPPIAKDCSPKLRKLLEACWAPNPVNRPSFAEIIKILDDIILEETIPDEVARGFW